MIDYIRAIYDTEDESTIQNRYNELQCQLNMARSAQLSAFMHQHAQNMLSRELTFFPCNENVSDNGNVYKYEQLIALLPKGVSGGSLITDPKLARSHPSFVFQCTFILKIPKKEVA